MQWQIGMKLFYISEALDKLLKTILNMFLLLSVQLHQFHHTPPYTIFKFCNYINRNQQFYLSCGRKQGVHDFLLPSWILVEVRLEAVEDGTPEELNLNLFSQYAPL